MITLWVGCYMLSGWSVAYVVGRAMTDRTPTPFEDRDAQIAAQIKRLIATWVTAGADGGAHSGEYASNVAFGLSLALRLVEPQE